MAIRITFPDGSVKEFADGATPREIAESIGPRLAAQAVAAKVSGSLVDLATPLHADAELRLITFTDPEGQDLYRHSSSHVMAYAVKRLFPRAKLAIGPAIEDGFYYDFEFPEPLNPNDIPRIEEEMQTIIKEDLPFQREEISKDAAIRLFSQTGENYKVEILHEIPDGETVSIYRNADFIDLCRGPHVPSTRYIKAFKLLSLAGAYWRGDQKRQMLQRIYGISFPDKKMLSDHLTMLEEAKKRDHRKLGKELDLFSFQEEGPGFPFFHPKGLVLFNQLIGFCRSELEKRGYQEVKTPIILNEEIWHRSGHWDNYRENMYFTRIDDLDYAVKPMNCPGGLLVYKTRLHSYREFPLRVAEFGLVHRHELSGVLHGLFRVRAFTQDDAHHFCLPEQLESEIVEIINLIHSFYRTFGFEDVSIELSTQPEKRIGSDEMWQRATAALENSLKALNLSYRVNPGAGAFYGPKIDFLVRDCLRRQWQLGTIQVDFSMPERFDLTYIAADGQRHRPVMIHRAIFGSLERFLGILIEHYGGNFPLWLAPTQITVLTLSENQKSYAQHVNDRLRAAGFRTTVDERDEKIGHKIREAELQKIPVMLILGEKEVSTQTVSVRRHRKGDLGSRTLDNLIAALQEEVDKRVLA